MLVVSVRYQWTLVRWSKGEFREWGLKIRWPHWICQLCVWWLVVSGMFVSVVVCFTGDVRTQPAGLQNKQYCTTVVQCQLTPTWCRAVDRLPQQQQQQQHCHHHHVFRRQSSPAARQDPLPEQLHWVFQEQRAVARVPVLRPKRGVLQNLQRLVHVLLLRTIRRWLHRGENSHRRLRKSESNAT